MVVPAFSSTASSSDLASSSVDAFRSRLQSRQRGATPSKGGAASQSSRHAVRTVRLKSRPEDFINLFVDAPYYLMEFLEYILSRHGSEETLLYDTLLELYLREEPVLCGWRPSPLFFPVVGSISSPQCLCIPVPPL